MNNMGKKIIVNVEHREIRVAILENNVLSEYYIERDDGIRKVGNIYKGRVDSIVPGIQSAFIDVGLEKNGFLYVTDICPEGLDKRDDISDDDFDLESFKDRNREKRINDLLKINDEIIVQVEKDPISTKGVRLTSYVSIPGRFLVLMPNVKHIGISKKISVREERDRLRQILVSSKMLNDNGCILRTAVEGKSEKQILAELSYLNKIWEVILKGMKKKHAPDLLYEEKDLIMRVMRDYFTDDVEEFIVDAKQEYNKIKSFLSSTSPEFKDRVKLYSFEEPIFDYYDLEKEIEKIYKKTVQLKSGGYLIIEQTEALVSIDVNTGKYRGAGDFEETVFRTNIEAAEEIPRQLKLRDIGGIIIIDFIDMKSKRNQLDVYKRLSSGLKNDKSKSNILQISKMGLLEMTRQRRGSGIYKTLHEHCPYCEGTGYIKSVISITLDVLRKLKKIFLTSSEKDFIVFLHPRIVERLLGEDREYLTRLEKKYNKRVDLRGDPEIHIEGIRINSSISKKQIV